jgi:ribosome-associated protein
MLRITDSVAIADWEITETFTRASGPGGQNVNKVASAVTLRFEAERSPHLPGPAKTRLKRLAGRRWTNDGAVIVSSERHRAQALNREDAREKLADLIRAALVPPKRRIPTRPGRGSIERRLATKAKRGAKKATRGKVDPEA